MNEEIRKAIELLEHYVACKKAEITKLSNLIGEAKGDNPIGDGYFRIVEYKGFSKHIQVGKVYKGRSFFNEFCKKKVLRLPRHYVHEHNASWVVASKEEYLNQRRKTNESA